jgi:hypothetical protein
MNCRLSSATIKLIPPDGEPDGGAQPCQKYGSRDPRAD